MKPDSMTADEAAKTWGISVNSIRSAVLAGKIKLVESVPAKQGNKSNRYLVSDLKKYCVGLKKRKAGKATTRGWVTVKQAAIISSRTETTIFKHINKGGLPAKKCFKQWEINKKVLIEYFESLRKPPVKNRVRVVSTVRKKPPKVIKPKAKKKKPVLDKPAPIAKPKKKKNPRAARRTDCMWYGQCLYAAARANKPHFDCSKCGKYEPNPEYMRGGTDYAEKACCDHFDHFDDCDCGDLLDGLWRS